MIVNPDKDVVVGTSGQISAPIAQSQNYVINSGASSIANYARWGDDLVVQFSSGQELRINNFFINGPSFHKLMLIDNGVRIDVDFSQATTNVGDGIADELINYSQVGESISVSTLLGILGGVAVAAGGLYGAYGEGREHHREGEVKNFLLPNKPIVDVTDDQEPHTGIVRNGSATNDTTPTLEGEGAIPGGTIKIYLEGQNPIYVPVNEDGTWSYTFSELADGRYVIKITQIDKFGRESEETVVNFEVDTVPPEAPIIQSVEDNVEPIGTVEAGSVTNDATPTFSGTGEPGSMITIYVGDKSYGTTIVDINGNWKLELWEDLPDGENTIVVTSTDGAGNESAPSEGFTFVVDTTPPEAIDFNSISFENNGTTGAPAAVTSSLRPSFEGKSSADAVYIEVFDNGVSIGKAQVNSDGSWIFVPDQDLELGVHNFSFAAVDAAGNHSSRTEIFQFLIIKSDDTNEELVEDTPSGDMSINDGNDHDSSKDDEPNGQAEQTPEERTDVVGNEAHTVIVGSGLGETFSARFVDVDTVDSNSAVTEQFSDNGIEDHMIITSATHGDLEASGLFTTTSVSDMLVENSFELETMAFTSPIGDSDFSLENLVIIANISQV